MKATAVAEAMICAFTAILEVMPPPAQRSAINILNAALAADATEGAGVRMIADADTRKVVECLVSGDDITH